MKCSLYTNAKNNIAKFKHSSLYDTERTELFLALFWNNVHNFTMPPIFTKLLAANWGNRPEPEMWLFLVRIRKKNPSLSLRYLNTDKIISYQFNTNQHFKHRCNECLSVHPPCYTFRCPEGNYFWNDRVNLVLPSRCSWVRPVVPKPGVTTHGGGMVDPQGGRGFISNPNIQRRRLKKKKLHQHQKDSEKYTMRDRKNALKNLLNVEIRFCTVPNFFFKFEVNFLKDIFTKYRSSVFCFFQPSVIQVKKLNFCSSKLN